MRELLFIIGFLQIQFCLCQNIGRLWYFGENAGLDFRSGTPVPLLNSGMFSKDGSSVITDKNDSLMFYTNGVYAGSEININ